MIIFDGINASNLLLFDLFQYSSLQYIIYITENAYISNSRNDD